MHFRLECAIICRKLGSSGTASWPKGTPNMPTCGSSITIWKGNRPGGGIGGACQGGVSCPQSWLTSASLGLLLTTGHRPLSTCPSLVAVCVLGEARELSLIFCAQACRTAIHFFQFVILVCFGFCIYVLFDFWGNYFLWLLCLSKWKILKSKEKNPKIICSNSPRDITPVT